MEPSFADMAEIQNNDYEYEIIFGTENLTQENNYINSMTMGNFLKENLNDLNPTDCIENLINKQINEKLIILEFTNKMKEKEILDLMFSLHDITKEIEQIEKEIKDDMEKTAFLTVVYKPTFNFKFGNSKDDSKNDSIMNNSSNSLLSKRSASISRSSKQTLRANDIKKEKTLIGAQKVTINIDLQETPVKKKRELHNTDNSKQAKLIEKNLKTNNENNKTDIVKDQSYSSLVKKKNSNNFSNKSSKVSVNSTEKNQQIINPNTKNNGTVCPFELKYPKSNSIPSIPSIPKAILNKKLSNKNSKDTNSTVDSTKLPVSPTQAQIRPSYKFEPKKKKNLSCSISDIKQTIINTNLNYDNRSSFKSENTSITGNLSEQNQILSRNNSDIKKSSTKIEKKSIFKKPKKSLLFNERLVNIFNDPENSDVFSNIFDYLSTSSEKIKLKNSSSLFRDIYFNNEIKNLKQIVSLKSKYENPLYNVKITNEDIFQKNLILSQIIYHGDKGFENLIVILFIILLKPNDIEELLRQRNTLDMINEIENCVNNDKNIYYKYKELIENLKNSKVVYNNLKYVKNNKGKAFFDLIYEFISNLTKEENSNFNVLLEITTSIDMLLEKGPNLELTIDIEILTHKLDSIINLKNKLSFFLK